MNSGTHKQTHTHTHTHTLKHTHVYTNTHSYTYTHTHTHTHTHDSRLIYVDFYATYIMSGEVQKCKNNTHTFVPSCNTSPPFQPLLLPPSNPLSSPLAACPFPLFSFHLHPAYIQMQGVHQTFYFYFTIFLFVCHLFCLASTWLLLVVQKMANQ